MAHCQLQFREDWGTIVAEIGLILLGALLSFAATLFVETWKQRRAARAAAAMLLTELEFHSSRLAFATQLDSLPGATYDLKFPAPIWSAHAGVLMTGFSLTKTTPILRWYATMNYLGFRIARQIGPEGDSLVGPPRDELAESLQDAIAATRKLARQPGGSGGQSST